MPLLLLLAEPKLALFQTVHPEYDLLNPKVWSEPLIFNFAVATDACIMLQLYLHFLPKGECGSQLCRGLVILACKGTSECLQILLKRAEPFEITYNHLSAIGSQPEFKIFERPFYPWIKSNGALYAALRSSRLDQTQILLHDPRTTLSFNSTKSELHILKIIPVERYDIYALIISDPRLPTSEIVDHLHFFLLKPPIIRLLLTRSELKFTQANYKDLADALNQNRLDTQTVIKSVQALNACPEFNAQRLLNYIYCIPGVIPGSLLLELLKNPSVDVNDLPEGFYFATMSIDNLDVFKFCLERFNPIMYKKISQMALTLPNNPQGEFIRNRCQSN